jgi:hypothetical protein
MEDDWSNIYFAVVYDMYPNKTCTNTSLKMNRDRSFRLSSTTHQRRPLQLNPGTLHVSIILFYWGFILFNLNSWHLLVKFPDFHVATSKSKIGTIPSLHTCRTHWPDSISTDYKLHDICCPGRPTSIFKRQWYVYWNTCSFTSRTDVRS